MKVLKVEGLTIMGPSKKALISFVRDLTKQVLDGKLLDPSWSVNKHLRVLGKMLKMAREM